MKKVAVVHDWLVGMRGGERVLEAILDCYPEADLYTLIADHNSISKKLRDRLKGTSWLNLLPNVHQYYRNLLPLMPFAIRSIDVRGYDLVISSSHCVAKGVRKSKRAKHISYVHAPMRYFWDRFEDYFGKGRCSKPVRFAALLLRPWFRWWDKRVSQKNRVDVLIANSQFIADQIKRHYGREAFVIHPFVDAERFQQKTKRGQDFLMVGAFAPNKRVDLAIAAFNRMGRTLKIIGGGQDERSLRKQAGPTIEFVGQATDAVIARAYAEARAFIFPGIEDFGITPLESMATGTPVIAFRAGGVVETVNESTGVFFDQPTVGSLVDAIKAFEKRDFDPAVCRSRALEFSRDRFKEKFLELTR